MTLASTNNDDHCYQILLEDPCFFCCSTCHLKGWSRMVRGPGTKLSLGLLEYCDLSTWMMIYH